MQQASAIFIEYFTKIDRDKLIFIDESGVHLSRNRGYGRAASNQRAISYTPFNKGTRVTMLAAIGSTEVKAATLGDGHVDGDIFLHCIREC